MKKTRKPEPKRLTFSTEKVRQLQPVSSNELHQVVGGAPPCEYSEHTEIC